MAKTTKIKWDLKGFKDIRKSQEVHEMLDDAAEQVWAAVDNGDREYGVAVDDMGDRYRGAVWTINFEAIKSEHENHDLLAALQGVIV